MAPMSWGVVILPAGICADIALVNSGGVSAVFSSLLERRKLVSPSPGLTALTLMPLDITSFARALVKAMTPPLAAL
jgi:hypothetical protein